MIFHTFNGFKFPTRQPALPFPASEVMLGLLAAAIIVAFLVQHVANYAGELQFLGPATRATRAVDVG